MQLRYVFPVPEHARHGRFPVPLHGGHARVDLTAVFTVLGATCSPLPLQARHAAWPVPLQIEQFDPVDVIAHPMKRTPRGSTGMNRRVLILALAATISGCPTRARRILPRCTSHPVFERPCRLPSCLRSSRPARPTPQRRPTLATAEIAQRATRRCAAHTSICASSRWGSRARARADGSARTGAPRRQDVRGSAWRVLATVGAAAARASLRSAVAS